MVWQHSLENPELRGMGTTLTAVGLVNEDGRDVMALVNVGDSRSYRFHDGELTQITTDHSLAEEMVRSGELTSVEADVHPHRHILTRALGVADDVAVDLWRIQPVRGDRYLLCSDGLTNELDNDQITEVLSIDPRPRQAAELLVQAARTHGGSDNITAVVIDVVVGDGDATAPAVAPVAADFTAADPEAHRGRRPRAAVPPIRVASRTARPRAARERRRARRQAGGWPGAPAHHLPDPAVRGPAGRDRRAPSPRSAGTTSTPTSCGDNNELVIYQGGSAGSSYHPVEVERTGVTTADVPAYALDAADDRRRGASCHAARLRGQPGHYQHQATSAQNPAAAGCATAGDDPATGPATGTRGPLMEKRIRRSRDLHAALLRGPFAHEVVCGRLRRVVGEGTFFRDGGIGRGRKHEAPLEALLPPRPGGLVADKVAARHVDRERIGPLCIRNMSGGIACAKIPAVTQIWSKPP